MAIFYELTDCSNVLAPIQTSTDLSGYVGTVITLADDTNHEIEVCRYVNPVQDLEIELVEVVIYKCHDTCEDCYLPHYHHKYLVQDLLTQDTIQAYVIQIL